MNPLDLTLEQRAALHAAARRRAEALRQQAFADAIDGAWRWLRRVASKPRAHQEVACHS